MKPRTKPTLNAAALVLLAMLGTRVPARAAEDPKPALPYVPDYEIIGPDSPLSKGLGEDRNALYDGPYRKHYRLPANGIGYLNLNPFAAYDAGLIPGIDADLGDASKLLQGSFYTAYPEGPNGSHGSALPVYRRFREGRASPVGWMSFKTPFSDQPTINRVVQKGGLATGRRGHHNDGLVDLEEGYVEIAIGEILNARGILSTRGLAAGHIAEQRHLETGEGRPSGAVHRFMEFPRFLDDQNARSAADRTLEFLKYEHPLLAGKISSIDSVSANWLIGLIQEAALKDQWVLHGSLSTLHSQNRSAGLVDFGTIAPLVEPNTEAQIGPYTSYGVEIRGNHEYRGSRNVRDEAGYVTRKPVPEIYDRLFDSSFAFYQLRRIGLTDEAILKRFREQEIPGIEKGSLGLRVADDRTLAFAQNIIDIDAYKVQSRMEFKADHEDPASRGTYWRVMVNTRKLLNALADPDVYRKASLSDDEISRLIRKSVNTFTLGDADQVWYHKISDTMRAELTGKVRFLHSYFHQDLGGSLDADVSGAAARRAWYPVDQDLPSREVLRGKIRGWIHQPDRFAPDFVEFVTGLVPKGGPEHDRWMRHYLGPSGSLEPVQARNERVAKALRAHFGADCLAVALSGI